MSKTQPASFIRRARVSSLGMIAVVLVAALVVAGPGVAPAVASSAERDHMLDLVNADRAEAGRHALELNSRLSRLAMHNSRRMADRRALSHSTKLRAGMSENVGSGPSLARIERAFMHSPPHRRNLLDRRADEVGVGVIKQGRRFWVTLVFLR